MQTKRDKPAKSETIEVSLLDAAVAKTKPIEPDVIGKLLQPINEKLEGILILVQRVSENNTRMVETIHFLLLREQQTPRYEAERRGLRICPYGVVECPECFGRGGPYSLSQRTKYPEMLLMPVDWKSNW